MLFAWEAFRANGGEVPGGETFPDIPPATPCASNPGEKDFSLQLRTDDYGEETSWKLFDSNSDVVVAGLGAYVSSTNYQFGPYCLASGSYRLTVYDAFGDGICCGYGQGSYSATLDGQPVLSSGGTFTCSENSDFVV